MHRRRTSSDHQQRVNRVLTFIAQNLNEPLSLDALANVACLSPFHFHRIFSAYIGESVRDHVHRLRLENAAWKLRHGRDSVTEIATASGYETPAAFTRAFRRHFDITPSEFRALRKPKVSIELPLDTPASVVSVRSPVAHLCSLTDRSVIYVRRVGPYWKAARDAWSALLPYAYSRGLVTPRTEQFGITYDDPEITPKERIRYEACITVDRQVSAEGEFGVNTLRGGRFARFVHRGSYETLAAVYSAIYGRWLSKSDVELRDAPSYARYLNRDPRQTRPEKLRIDIYIPIK